MSIFKRILLACCLVSTLGLLQAGYLVYRADYLAVELDHGISHPIRQLDSTFELWDAFKIAQRQVDEVVEGVQFQRSDDALSQFSREAEKIERLLSAIETTLQTSTSRVSLAKARTSLGEWRRQSLALLGANPTTSIPAPHIVARTAADVRASLSELVRDAKAVAANVREEVIAEVAILKGNAIFIGVLTTLVGVAIAFLSARSLTRPIAELLTQMRALTEGQLEIAIVHRGRRDEIGAMANALAIFQENARDTENMRAQRQKQAQENAAAKAVEMETLAQAFEASVAMLVGAVSASAREMRANSMDMVGKSIAAEQKASSGAETSREAMTNVRSVAVATEQLSGSVLDISHQTEMARTMSEAAASHAQTSSEIMSSLSSSVAQIGAVVSAIGAIANQTNLLALNATIEAARAGEAGKGFAVVASEVKMLAGQTRQATQEIAMQIEAVQQVTQDVVGAIGEISSAIPLIRDVSVSIARSMREQEKATREIAIHIEHAATRAEDVAETIATVLEAARESGEGSRSMLGASDDLLTQTGRLDEEVRAFVAKVRAS